MRVYIFYIIDELNSLSETVAADDNARCRALVHTRRALSTRLFKI